MSVDPDRALAECQRAWKAATVTLLELLDLHMPEAGEGDDFGDVYCQHCGADEWPCNTVAVIWATHPNLKQATP